MSEKQITASWIFFGGASEPSPAELLPRTRRQPDPWRLLPESGRGSEPDLLLYPPHHGYAVAQGRAATPSDPTERLLSSRWRIPQRAEEAYETPASIRGAIAMAFSRIHLYYFRLEPAVDLLRQLASYSVQLESPRQRAENTLNLLREDARKGCPFGERAHLLSRLAAIPAVQELLWSALEGKEEPRVRWAIMDVLAARDWPRLAHILVNGLKRWDTKSERTAVLGAVATVRRHRVPDELRAELADVLRKRLWSFNEPARQGQEPEQTELLCEIIDTFRSFAVAEDLDMLRDFWQTDSIFPVQLRAIEAATQVVSRFPDAAFTEKFFQYEASNLSERLNDLIRERLVAVENGTLLWRVAALLLSRFGKEALSIVEVARCSPSLSGRLLRATREAEGSLNRLGHTDWLAQQKENIDAIRTELIKLRDQG